MVINHLKEEEYIPKLRQGISLKEYEDILEPSKKHRRKSMPKLKSKNSERMDLKTQSYRGSLAQIQIPKLIKNTKSHNETRNNKEIKIFTGADEDESKNYMTPCLSPILDNDSDRPEIDADISNLDSTKQKYESIINHTHKTVGKAKFGRASVITRSHDSLLPKLSHKKTETSADSIRKMPKIVRKILEKKMHLNPSFMRSIDDKEMNKNVI